MRHLTGLLVLCCALGLIATARAEEAPAGEEPPVKSIALFNGMDFSGLKLFLPDEKADPAQTWRIEDGVLYCTGNPAGYFRTTEQYENYTLRLEWRFGGEPGNSGVLLHVQDKDEVWPKSIEAQLHHRDAGDIWVIGGATFKEHGGVSNRRVIKKHPSSEKPLGEWNEYLIECHGDNIVLYVNGVEQNRATACTITKGYIGFQSEGAPIQFRNITLTPKE